MAESVREKIIENTLSRVVNENSTNVECAVCLQTCIHPAELPCGHVFCYLCIKGIVNQGRRCAMCRQDIPVDYLDKPRLLRPVDTENTNHGFEDGHLWFYEGFNGWWQYDERTSVELESAYQKGERCCELLIAGFLYIADFDAMLQYRRNDPSRRRRIKRDLATTTKKGVAGLKATKNSSLTSSVPDLVSNELIQSLPISAQSIRNNLNNMRLFSLPDVSPSNSGQQNSESVFDGARPRRHSAVTSSSYSPCDVTTRTNSTSHNDTNLTSRNEANLDSQIENDNNFYSRNLNLDNIIHDTLDWTIEQIESLNLELLNDYEILFRDVSNYGLLHDNLDRRRSSSRSNNYLSQYLNSRNTSSLSLENELDLNERPQNFSQSNHSEGYSSSAESSSFSPQNDLTSSVISENGSQRPELPNQTSTTPQPPPRTRGMTRIRSRIMSPRHSTSRETLF